MANQSVGMSQPRMVEDEDGSTKKTKMLLCKYTNTDEMISRCFGNFLLRGCLRKYTDVTKRH